MEDGLRMAVSQQQSLGCFCPLRPSIPPLLVPPTQRLDTATSPSTATSAAATSIVSSAALAGGVEVVLLERTLGTGLLGAARADSSELTATPTPHGQVRSLACCCCCCC